MNDSTRAPNTGINPCPASLPTGTATTPPSDSSRPQPNAASSSLSNDQPARTLLLLGEPHKSLSLPSSPDRSGAAQGRHGDRNNVRPVISCSSPLRFSPFSSLLFYP
ncbi:uncharacterized protein CC84DRAFT_870408 [Paraphaeosphaeria sporulosa]|uniref:Uncharacterized protein n=1 Tax=Paraphaeosphaeria sporulosa TaxID=1460663 RepID=A0A177CAS5_9PLEO|nr:uncharacterized protein CC84DRAFT_870408 [Paraphaeosphaeria sporulosa]OAG03867.1 hypothetical protein CC84DRAFT_870408 [Paraphaeosphaeria sporulosa]